MQLGQDIPPSPPTYLESERAPTSQELTLWERAKRQALRVKQLSYALKLQYRNLGLTHKFAQSRKIALVSGDDLPELEARMFTALSEVDRLSADMHGVEDLNLGIRLSSTGNDLDILQPEPQQLGWVIPVVIGAVIVVGIIARWAYLEKEVLDISNRYNGVLRRADQQLCSDPNSVLCADWEETKKSGNYYSRETVIDKVKKAAAKVGGALTSGLGAGVAIAIPLLMLLYLPKPRRER